MMQQLYKIGKEEKGAFLVLMMLGVVSLLAIAGLAIDICNMFYAKVQLQKAADAAVLAGLEYRLENGPLKDDSKNSTYQNTLYSDHKTIGQVKDRAREITNSNLRLNLKTLDSSPITSDPKYTIGTSGSGVDVESLSVELSAKIKFLLLGNVPLEMINGGKMPKVTSLSADSTGEIKPGRIALILDFSTSMACPFQSGIDFELPFIPSGQNDLPAFYSILDAQTPKISYPDTTPTSDPTIIAQRRESYATLIKSHVYCSCMLESFYNPFPDSIDGNTYKNPENPCDPLASTSKFVKLVDSVHEFLSYFKTNRDQIAIIPFNLSSTVFKSLNSDYLSSDLQYWDKTNGGIYADIRSEFDATPGVSNPQINLGEWTNPSDGLLAAFQDNYYFLTKNQGNRVIDRETHYVLFTDGAPTAGRFSFTNTKIPLSNGLSSYQFRGKDQFGANANISTNYGLSGNSNISDSILLSLSNSVRTYYQGSAILFRYPIWSLGKLLSAPQYTINNPLYGIEYNELASISNSYKQSCVTGTPTVSSDGSVDNYCGCFNDTLNLASCSNIFQYQSFPVSMNEVVPQTITSGFPTVSTYKYTDTGDTLSLENNYAKMYYDLTISYADHIRANKGYVYTIGLGPLAKEVTEVEDKPYQEYLNPYTRKDYFLSRVAFAKYSPYQEDFPNVEEWGNLMSGPYTDQNGFYLPAQSSEELASAFGWLAKYLSRITQ